MHKNFTYSDPGGSFTWLHPVSLQQDYLVPPDDHEEAIELFRAHPDFEKLLRAYREASESRGGSANVWNAVRSGLKRLRPGRRSPGLSRFKR